MAVALARIRVPLVHLGLAAMVVDSFLWDLPRWPLLAFLTVAFAVYLRLGTVRRPPGQVAVPVTGRWLAYNSPADRVPSHHLHAYGQTYAIDLVHVPEGRHRPEARLVAAGTAAPGLPRLRPARAGPSRRRGGAGPRPRARPLEPHLPAGHAVPAARGGAAGAAETRAHPRQPRRARPRRRGLRPLRPPAARLAAGAARRAGRAGPAARRVRELRQLQRAAPALPANEAYAWP
jgi:hypothetical protein